MPNSNETHLHLMLDDLRTQLLSMGTKTGKAIDDACHALVQRNVELAGQVIEGDCEIDAMENQIDELTLSILARIQPVARDLRFVMTAIRMVLDIERIGDEAVFVARRAISLKDYPPSAMIGDLQAYGERTLSLFNKSMNAFREGDVQLAIEICHSDHNTAEMTESLTRSIIDNVMSGKVDAHIGIYAQMIIRALDRICRRTQNIAEHTCFMVRGENIKHLPPDAYPTC